jgi:hypothetical protein
LCGADLFGTFVGGLDGLANEYVEDIHGRLGPSWKRNVE